MKQVQYNKRDDGRKMQSYHQNKKNPLSGRQRSRENMDLTMPDKRESEGRHSKENKAYVELGPYSLASFLNKLKIINI